MSGEQSVTRWFREMEAGDGEAAGQLWFRYFHRLVGLARKQLGKADRRAADEEDIALSVFNCLCEGAVQGRFAELANRQELWRLLVQMTGHKVIDHVRFTQQTKRGGGRVRGLDARDRDEDGRIGNGLDQLADGSPSPELLVMLTELHNRLMSMLDVDGLRQIAMWKLEGFRNQEIAERIGITTRSVERKLQRIRSVWSREFDA